MQYVYFIVITQILQHLSNFYANACGLQQVKGQHISTPFLLLFLLAGTKPRDYAHCTNHAKATQQMHLTSVHTTKQNRRHLGVLQAQKPVQVTCPYGSLDPLMDRAHLALFPVSAGLLQGTAELHSDAQRSGLDETRYGQSFCSNAFKGDAAAMLAAAQRQAYISCLRASVYMLMGQS